MHGEARAAHCLNGLHGFSRGIQRAVVVRSFSSEFTAFLAIMPLQKLSRRNDRVTVRQNQ